MSNVSKLMRLKWVGDVNEDLRDVIVDDVMHWGCLKSDNTAGGWCSWASHFVGPAAADMDWWRGNWLTVEWPKHGEEGEKNNSVCCLRSAVRWLDSIVIVPKLCAPFNLRPSQCPNTPHPAYVSVLETILPALRQRQPIFCKTPAGIKATVFWELSPIDMKYS